LANGLEQQNRIWEHQKIGKKWSGGLGKQYVITHFSSQMTKLNTEFLKTQAEQMKMSEKDVEKMMLAMKYEAMGVMTLDPKTGEYVGH